MQERGERSGDVVVAVVGAGFIGRGLVAQLGKSPGMRLGVLVNRSVDRAVGALAAAGVGRDQITISDDATALASAIQDRRPAVTTAADVLAELDDIDVVVEATGAMDHGATVIRRALAAGKDVVSMNAEVDATVGWLLQQEAARRDVVYTLGDGDQPGVLLRHLEFVEGMGFEVVAAVNCKRNLDIHQNPTDSQPYADRDGTSVLMTTAFGDGTKMQIENACVANLSGLVPDQRGMHGVETDLAHAVDDIPAVLSRHGVVEYTRGGDFGGGVAVVGYGEGPHVQPYMRYSKMGEGPYYFFFRPYHLLHFEVPWTIAEVVLDCQHLGVVQPVPVADVVAVAKKDLSPGERIDGIGGYCVYGHISQADQAGEFLPVGLAEHATVVRDISMDQPVPRDAVEIADDAPLVRMRAEQDAAVASAPVPSSV